MTVSVAHDVIHCTRDLYAKEVAGKGRGVFADALIRAGQIIEVCPVIILDEADAAFSEKTALRNYSFDWSEPYGSQRAFPLGFGMLYNHSFTPNARYVRNSEEKIITFIALRDIQPHEEILVNYNGDPHCTKSLFPEMLHFEIA